MTPTIISKVTLAWRGLFGIPNHKEFDSVAAAETYCRQIGRKDLIKTLSVPLTLEERDAADLAAGRDPLTGEKDYSCGACSVAIGAHTRDEDCRLS